MVVVLFLFLFEIVPHIVAQDGFEHELILLC